MPALDQFLRPFPIHFQRSEATHARERYRTGMVTEHPNTNCDPIAPVVPDTSEQSLPGLLPAMRGDDDDLYHQRVQDRLAWPTEGDAARIVDDTGFVKQGKSSVGGARQDSGTWGKVGTGQGTVNGHYAERTIVGSVATRLDRSKEWASAAARRLNATVPEAIAFQTKPAIALDLLDQADSGGVPDAGVVADADSGDHPNFLEGLENRAKRSGVAVRKDFPVARPIDGPAPHAEVVLDAVPQRRWRTIRGRERSQGGLTARFGALRCWREPSVGLRVPGWLIGERPARGRQPDQGKDHWSNFHGEAPLKAMVEYAHRRVVPISTGANHLTLQPSLEPCLLRCGLGCEVFCQGPPVLSGAPDRTTSSPQPASSPRLALFFSPFGPPRMGLPGCIPVLVGQAAGRSRPHKRPPATARA